MKLVAAFCLLLSVHIICTAQIPFIAGDIGEAPQILPLWTAGGVSGGNDSAGQAARITSDASGNVTVVSGPGFYGKLVVTSYTSSGVLRWQRTIEPSIGTFRGDWVVAAINGDFIEIGHNQDSHGRPIQSTMVRYDTNGTLLWRVDFSSGFYPVVARLIVDSAGNAYVAWSATGSGLFVHKYSPSGVLLWARGSSTGGIYAVATSLVLSPDEVDVVVTGDVSGGALWITAAFNATSGVPRWEVAAEEGTAARDVVVDPTCVYVTGQGVTDPGTVGMRYWLSVVAYDRATGARLWRTDKMPVDGSQAAGLWMAKAYDGSIVVTGQAARGFLDWYTVVFEINGTVRWEAVRDGGLNTDEIPAGVLVMADGTTVVTGRGGPNLPGGYWPGVTAGYSPNGTLLWEAFSRLPTVWATALPNGDVCATGGYDAFITCFRIPGALRPPPAPTNLAAIALTQSSIGLSWTNGTTEQTGVKIERCLGSRCTNFVQIATVVGTATNYTNSGLSARTHYRYQVRAYNDAGNSQYSNIAAARTLAYPPQWDQ